MALITSIAANVVLNGTIHSDIQHMNAMTSLSLTNCNLSGSLPPRIHPSLASLFLFNNKLSGTLPDEFFPMNSNLTTLRLEGNEFTGTLPNSLSRATKLVTLEIACPWSKVPLNLDRFSLLTGLTRLNLNSVEFTPVTIGTSFVNALNDTLAVFFGANVNFNRATLAPWANFTKLVTLQLVNANLTGTVPLLASSLTQLSLDRNDLVGDLQYASMPNLVRLAVGNTKLNWMTTAIGRLSSLTSLTATFTNATGPLPTEIALLTQLNQLSIQNNAITALRSTIGLLTQLTQLNVQSNALTALPSTIGQLTQLNQLNAQINAITALPSTIGQLTQLVQLNVQSNALTALPTTIFLLSRLERVDISNNFIVGPDLAPFADFLANLTLCRFSVANDKNCFASTCPMNCCGITGMLCPTSVGAATTTTTTTTTTLAVTAPSVAAPTVTTRATVASPSTAGATIASSTTTGVTIASSATAGATIASSAPTATATASNASSGANSSSVAVLATSTLPAQAVGSDQALGIGIGAGAAALFVLVAIGVAVFICRKKPARAPPAAEMTTPTREHIYGSMLI